MTRPVIALLTDFGLRDHYAAAMKGVALGICPEATLVDISHEIPPHDVLAGALELGAVYRDFPAATIFLAVVDPGVGSARRAVAAEIGGYRFVAPDNGVLSIVLDRESAADPPIAVEIVEPRYQRPAVGRTFEGRDRFAPAAAWLASGVELTSLGPPAPPLLRLGIGRPTLSAEHIDGEVLRVDRFGNLVTNIDRAIVEAFAGDRALTIRIGDRELPRVSTYAEAEPGELCALFSSSDHLEIAANSASAAAALHATRGTRVRVVRRPS